MEATKITLLTNTLFAVIIWADIRTELVAAAELSEDQISLREPINEILLPQNWKGKYMYVWMCTVHSTALEINLKSNSFLRVVFVA